MGIPFRFSPVDMANFVSQFENHQASRSTSGGNLISTNDRPRALNSPDSSIAPNRVQQVSTEIRNQTPGNSLRKLTGSDSTQVQS